MSLSEPLARVPAEGSVFETSWPVRTGDIDVDNRLRLDGVARYLQDIGFDNLDAVGARGTHPFWIVRRTVIDVIRPVVWPDHVQLKRWCSALSSRWCNMRVQLESSKGALIETEGFWININRHSGMPSRMSDEFMGPLSSTTQDQRLKWKRWLTDEMPDLDGTQFPLRVTDIDPFDHVNNAVYWQAVEEHLRTRPDFHAAPFRAVIEYLKPLMADDKVSIRRRDDEGSLTLWFVVDEELRATAVVSAR